VATKIDEERGERRILPRVMTPPQPHVGGGDGVVTRWKLDREPVPQSAVIGDVTVAQLLCTTGRSLCGPMMGFGCQRGKVSVQGRCGPCVVSRRCKDDQHFGGAMHPSIHKHAV